MQQRADIAALVKQKQWHADSARRIMDAFEESGLRAHAFSELYGFNEKRISAWKLRFGLRERGKARSSTPVVKPHKEARRADGRVVRIVPVHVRGEDVGKTPSAEAPHMIEVQTPSGCVLRVPSEFDGRAVGRMLTLLGVAGC